tara:strand:- start:730 stop:1050 length:321 start_codon:yes stop_codon:yes gene_type:complete
MQRVAVISQKGTVGRFPRYEILVYDSQRGQDIYCVTRVKGWGENLSLHLDVAEYHPWGKHCTERKFATEVCAREVPRRLLERVKHVADCLSLPGGFVVDATAEIVL